MGNEQGLQRKHKAIVLLIKFFSHRLFIHAIIFAKTISVTTKLSDACPLEAKFVMNLVTLGLQLHSRILTICDFRATFS